MGSDPREGATRGQSRGGRERGLLSASPCETQGRFTCIHHLGPSEVRNGLAGLRKVSETVSG